MEQEKSKHVQGKPWKIEAKFKTFKEAEAFKLQAQEAENPPEEIKIKHMNSTGLFVVKTRRENKKSKKDK